MDNISPMTLAAAMALGTGGGGDTPSAKVYYPAGSVPFLGLPALSESKIGAVYDVTDEFTSTEDFTDGGGKKYSAGTNVAIVNIGTEASPVLKYDCMMGDLSEILNIIPSTATAQNKLATSADVSGNSIPSTSTTSPLTDSADGMVQGLTVYGRSKKSKNLFSSGFEQGVIYASGGMETVPTRIRTSDYIPISENTEYHIRTSQGSAKSKPQIANFVFYDKNQNYISSIPDVDASEITFNSVENARFCKMSFYDSTNSQNNISPADVVGAQIQLELGSTATDYEPYFEGIKSVGDDGLTVTTANSDNTVTTSAEFTTALPLCGVSDTVRDKLICTADVKQVEKVCAEVDLGALNYWRYSTDSQIFWNYLPNNPANNGVCLCDLYTFSQTRPLPNKTIRIGTTGYYANAVAIKDTDYTDPAAFKTAMSGVKLVYELATPTITPLTSAEISAFRGLKTYDSTTNITITDEPDFELDYLKNTDNGQAVADIQTDLQGQIDEVKSTAVMGSTIVVVTDEPTLYGRPVTVTAGTKAFTGTFDSSGECTFRNLAIYGAVQVESTDGDGNSAKGSTNITYFGTYVVGISFNVATINLTCSDVSFAGVPVSIYYNGEVVAETSLRLNGQGVLEGTAYVENTGRYTAVAVSAGNTVFTSVAVISLKQTYTGTLAASYLPNSDIEHIICEAYGDNFVEGALTWGNGQTPVAFNLNGGSVAPTLQEDNSVYIPVAASNIFASVDLGAPATPFTAYVVMKLRNPGTDSRMIGAMNSRSGGQGILLYSSTIQISSWANETSTGISSAQYVVCAIQFVGANLGRGFVRGYGYAEKPSATAGQYVTLARPDINPSTGNASPGDGYFKYVAVVNEAESIQTVQANIEHLNSVFLGE